MRNAEIERESGRAKAAGRQWPDGGKDNVNETPRGCPTAKAARAEQKQLRRVGNVVAVVVLVKEPSNFEAQPLVIAGLETGATDLAGILGCGEGEA